ncbi:kinase-like domain-containing protein [Apiospora phragmitis]|uniref:Kinase-like domain-containing protein n=1 Tax=Apiospora phragmitis TaxID=2905665 RepID=A0ABR1TD76_9PEZI
MSVDTAGDQTSDLIPYNAPGMITPPASSPNKSGSSKKSEVSSTQAEDRLSDVQTYFANTGLKYRRAIATGNHGGTLLFDQFGGADGTTLEKIVVVKYALDTEEDASTNNDEDLANEMAWLERFVHAQHIIQLTPEYRRLWHEEQEGGGAGSLLKRPVIVMEYMEHGTLHQMKHRFRHAGLRIPDRMVWHFAFCWLNVLIADVIPSDEEHDLIPLLKLIDFGRGVELDSNEVYLDTTWGDKNRDFFQSPRN